MEEFYVSQYGEDFFLDEIFLHKHHGICIDVGASEGIRFNNSYFFDLFRNWKCICVEPHAQYYELLCNNRSPNTTKIQCAVSDFEKDKTTFYTNKRGSLSTLNKELESSFAKSYKDYFFGFKEQQISVTTLNSIIKNNLNDEEQKNIDFISIDVEGTEIDTLKGLDLVEYRVPILIIELNDFATIDSYLKKYDYKLITKKGCNGIYSNCKDKYELERYEEIISCDPPPPQKTKHILD
jgi:FkbM family methyltransferase